MGEFLVATCVWQKRSSGRTISDDDRSFSTPLGEHLRSAQSLQSGRVVGEGTDSREHCQHHQAREDDGTQEGWWRRAGDCYRGGDSESDCQDDCATVGRSSEVSTVPFQFTLSTRAGCECTVHVLQMLTAYDSISGKAMVEGLALVPGGSAVLPFVHLFHPTFSESGKMIVGGSTPREIPSCHSSFPLANIQFRRQSSDNAQITL